MITRQLEEPQYKNLCRALARSAHTEPLETSYTVTTTVNSAEYTVRLQPEKHCKMAVLQAFRLTRSKGYPDFELITGGGLLSAFLELLVCQGIE